MGCHKAVLPVFLLIVDLFLCFYYWLIILIELTNKKTGICLVYNWKRIRNCIVHCQVEQCTLLVIVLRSSLYICKSMYKRYFIKWHVLHLYCGKNIWKTGYQIIIMVLCFLTTVYLYEVVKNEWKIHIYIFQVICISPG